MSDLITVRGRTYCLYCSLLLEGYRDILAAFLGSSHIVWIYTKSMVNGLWPSVSLVFLVFLGQSAFPRWCFSIQFNKLNWHLIGQFERSLQILPEQIHILAFLIDWSEQTTVPFWSGELLHPMQAQNIHTIWQSADVLAVYFSATFLPWGSTPGGLTIRASF